MNRDELEYNNLNAIITANLTIRELKAVLKDGINFDGVICTSIYSYTPTKSDYVDAVMSGFFYLHHLNGTSSTAMWMPCQNWATNHHLFTHKAWAHIEEFMKGVQYA